MALHFYLSGDMPKADHLDKQGRHKPTLPLASRPEGVGLRAVNGRQAELRVGDSVVLLNEDECRWLWGVSAAVWSRLDSD